MSDGTGRLVRAVGYPPVPFSVLASTFRDSRQCIVDAATTAAHWVFSIMYVNINVEKPKTGSKIHLHCITPSTCVTEPTPTTNNFSITFALLGTPDQFINVATY